jgi:uncharacterized protein (TIGR02757 family)
MADKLKDFLDAKVKQFNQVDFIKNDPVFVPHLFTKKADIEIAGFFAATFAWGIRATIIKKSLSLMQMMDMSPHDFIIHHQPKDLKPLLGFRHRTFNDTDLLYFIEFLRHHYTLQISLETAFFPSANDPKSAEPVEEALNHFYRYFFSLADVPARTKKHVASPARKSSCKRLNMFLRWMVRKDDCGVDFGLWNRVTPAQLICPVDLHVARVAQRFNLLQRQQVDWQAALDLTAYLRKLDSKDPVKYDFALFGLGINDRY